MGVVEVKPPQALPPGLLGTITFSGCLNEAVRNSGKDDHEIADEIHICHGYMSRFMRGVGQQWAKRIVAFMRATNSIAPLEWIAEQMGCDVTLRSAVARERDALKARLAELDRQGRAAA